MSAYDYDTIGRYVDEAMNPDERRAFELSLSQDEGLKKEVEMYRNVQDELRMALHPDKEEELLRQTLASMREELLDSRGRVVRLRGKGWWLAAAVAAAMVGLFLWQPWATDPYREFISNKMAPIAERGASTDSLLQLVTAEFNHQKYDQSLGPFEKLLQKQPDNAYVRFYYAISLLQSGQIVRSRSEFQEIFQGNSLFQFDAALYMGIGYLKQKDLSSGREWLRKIPADASSYGKAQALLKKID